MIKTVNRETGEVIELTASTFDEVLAAWQVAKEYERVGNDLKDQLKKLVPKFVDDNGKSKVKNGYMFRLSNVQRMTYDKAVLREVFDADELDLLLKPDKKAVDNYIKDHLEELGEKSTLIRSAMVADGKAYEVIKLEKVER
jgi:hypothetical protein